MHMVQVENNARCLRMMGNRTMEDLDIDEAECQLLLDELTDAKNNLVQHTGHVLGYWVWDHHFVFLDVLEDNSDLPPLEFEG